jgi:hypothetical protein
MTGLGGVYLVSFQMPFSKDIRTGQGWFDTNVNWFFNYLDDLDEELIVKDDFCPSEVKYHNNELEERIESRVNEYISWKVFGENRKALDEDDRLPNFFEDDVWGYVYHHICMFVRRKPTWYELKSTLPDEEREESHESPEDVVQTSETKSSGTKNVYAEYVGTTEFTIPSDVKEYAILWETLYYEDKDGNEVEVSPNYCVEDDIQLTKRPRKTYEKTNEALPFSGPTGSFCTLMD